jgi:hypothetical protein
MVGGPFIAKLTGTATTTRQRLMNDEKGPRKDGAKNPQGRVRFDSPMKHRL